jgi:hypothetical protein
MGTTELPVLIKDRLTLGQSRNRRHEIHMYD